MRTDNSTSREAVVQTIQSYLHAQGIQGASPFTDKDLSAVLAVEFVDRCLTRCVDDVMAVQAPMKVDGIVGFAFGHRFDSHGNREPGPINARLAELVTRYFEAINHKCGLKLSIWVEWEIGSFLREGEIADHVRRSYPSIDIVKDQVAYKSTRSTVEFIGKTLPPESGAKLLVVAHPDHARRCSALLNAAGYETIGVEYGPSDISDWYDPESGQLWTSLRHLYLIHDAIGQLNDCRDLLNSQAKAKRTLE